MSLFGGFGAEFGPTFDDESAAMVVINELTAQIAARDAALTRIRVLAAGTGRVTKTALRAALGTYA